MGLGVCRGLYHRPEHHQLHSYPHPPCPPPTRASEHIIGGAQQVTEQGGHLGEACALNCQCGKGFCARYRGLCSTSAAAALMSPHTLARLTASFPFASGLCTSLAATVEMESFRTAVMHAK